MWMFCAAGGRLACGVRMHMCACLCVVHDLRVKLACVWCMNICR
jgi:hypothetical protein